MASGIRKRPRLTCCKDEIEIIKYQKRRKKILTNYILSLNEIKEIVLGKATLSRPAGNGN